MPLVWEFAFSGWAGETEARKLGKMKKINTRKSLTAALSLVLLVFTTKALSAEFRHLTTADGLSHNSILTLYEDHYGFTWIGTPDGLNRFDGFEFRTFRHIPGNPNSLDSNLVRSVIETADHTIWVATDFGINRIEPATWNVHRYLLKYPEGDARIPIRVGARDFYLDVHGQLWVATSAGVYRYQANQDTFEIVHPAQTGFEAVRLRADSLGRVWVLFSNKVDQAYLSRLGASSEGSYEVNNTTGPTLDFLIDTRDQLWINGVGPYPIASLAASITLPSSSLHMPIAHSMVGNEGVLWFGSEDGVVSHNQLEYGRLHLSQTQNSWLSKFILYTMTDSRGGRWFGTLGGVFYEKMHAKPFVTHVSDSGSESSLSGNAISALIEDHQGGLWVGTFGNGLNKIDATGSVTRYSLGSACDGLIWTLFFREQQLWVGTEQGLCRFDPDQGRVVDVWRGPTEVRRGQSHRATHGQIDDEGWFWLATYRGLVKYNPETDELVRFQRGFSDLRVNVLLIENDVIWLGLSDGVLHRFDRNTGEVQQFPMLDAEGERLSVEGIYDIFVDSRHRLWIASGVGLSDFDRQSGRFTHYREPIHLNGSIAYSIQEDDQGDLWISTSKGVTRAKIDGGRLSFRTYDVSDGLGNVEFNRNVSTKRRDGRLAFGGQDGVSEWLPSAVVDNIYTPPATLTGIEVLQQDNARQVSPFDLDELILRPNDNTVSFEYSAMSYTNSARTRFAHQLEGFDEDWVEAGNRRFARYTNLPPGKYTFRVRSANNDGFWNYRGQSLPVTVLPAYWQTWWFVASVSLLLALLITLAYRYRISRLLELERLRLRIAADLHDELGSQLSSIAMSTSFIEQSAEISTDQKARLSRVRSTAEDAAEAIRNIVWYLSPEHDTLQSLVLRMRHVAGEMLANKTLAFVDTLDTPELPLEMGQRRNLFMFFQETLSNIARHSKASEVEISLMVESRQFDLRIIDNGVGFSETDLESNGNGLVNLKRRAKQLRGRCDISSSPGQGCTVSLSAELKVVRAATIKREKRS